MTKLLLAILSVSSMPLWAETGIRDLTPRATDSTAARVCGQDVEKMKAEHGFNRRVVLKGGEIMKNMQFCQNGRLQFSPGKYRIVVANEEVVFWTNDEGRDGVIEGCANLAQLEIPVPAEPPATPPSFPELPPFQLGPPPDLSLPPWEPVTPPAAPTPAPPPAHDCPRCAAIMSDYRLSEMTAKTGPVAVWAVIEDGTISDGAWTLTADNGKGVYILGRGLKIVIDPVQLYKLVGGKSGDYYLNFTGKDSDKHVIACGLKGTLITLVHRGRHWFWKLPLIHCVYAYTAGIKDWSLGGTLEKALVCPAEAAAMWYFWPVAGKMPHLIKIAGPPGGNLSPI